MTDACISAFGSGALGAAPFGSGVAIALASVRQDTLNSAIATFTVAVSASDPGDVTDALNVALWNLTALGNATVRLVQYVERVDDTSVRVYFDGPLAPFAQYELTVLDSVTALSGGSLSPSCSSEVFSTMGWPRDLVPRAADVPQNVDIANPFMPRDAPSQGAPLGTYQIATVGDWLNDSGVIGLRKRVFRVLTTPPGGFFHLPNYGVDPELEQLVRRDDLDRLQQAATRQLRAMPDVSSATVTASQAQDDPTLVLLVAKVTDVYGKSETVAARVRPRRGS